MLKGPSKPSAIGAKRLEIKLADLKDWEELGAIRASDLSMRHMKQPISGQKFMPKMALLQTYIQLE